MRCRHKLQIMKIHVQPTEQKHDQKLLFVMIFERDVSGIVHGITEAVERYEPKRKECNKHEGWKPIRSIVMTPSPTQHNNHV